LSEIVYDIYIFQYKFVPQCARALIGREKIKYN